LHLNREAEVVHHQVTSQERVVLEAGALADDLALVDRPELGVTGPAGQVFAVEQVDGGFGGGGDWRLRWALQICDEGADFVRAHRLQLVVRHQRLVGRLDAGNIAARDGERFRGGGDDVGGGALALLDAGDEAAAFQFEDGDGVLLRDDGARIDDV